MALFGEKIHNRWQSDVEFFDYFIESYDHALCFVVFLCGADVVPLVVN